MIGICDKHCCSGLVCLVVNKTFAICGLEDQYIKSLFGLLAVCSTTNLQPKPNAEQKIQPPAQLAGRW
jgi:hypothetical protein